MLRCVFGRGFKKTLFGAKTLWFLCRPDGLNVPTKKNSRSLATLKRCTWHFVGDGGLQSGPSPLRKRVARVKTSSKKKANIAKPNAPPRNARCNQITIRPSHQLRRTQPPEFSNNYHATFLKRAWASIVSRYIYPPTGYLYRINSENLKKNCNCKKINSPNFIICTRISKQFKNNENLYLHK